MRPTHALTYRGGGAPQRNTMVTITAEPLVEPMPDDLSWPRLRRRLLVLGGILVAVAAVVSLLPGLGDVRDRFAEARPGWIMLGLPRGLLPQDELAHEL
jgi:hypothetical protein